MIDLWFNVAVEQQAFGRVFRMGQTKETHFVRIVTRKSVDTRLLKLQQKKSEMIARTVQEFRSDSVKMTVEDVAQLLGKPKLDKDGNVVGVESDYSEDEESEDEAEDPVDEESQSPSSSDADSDTDSSDESESSNEDHY